MMTCPFNIQTVNASELEFARKGRGFHPGCYQSQGRPWRLAFLLVSYLSTT